MLMQQPDVEATLARRLDVPARLPEPVAALHQLLSPKTRDYWALAKWGAAAYEQTLQVYVDDVQRTHPTDGRGGS
jgi:hypothetical protein